MNSVLWDCSAVMFDLYLLMFKAMWWFYEEENSYGNVNDFSGDFDNILSCLFPSFILITLHPHCHNIKKISSSSSSSSHDCDSDQGAHIRLIPLTHFLLNNHSMTLPSYRHCHYQCDTILGLQTIIQGHCHLALIIIPSGSFRVKKLKKLTPPKS